MIIIDVEKKAYGAAARLEIKEGEFVSVFGPSGAGKTTILRMIAGLTTPERGLIKVGDDVWFDQERGINWPVQKRSIGFVFQEYTVFPNMTVRENVEFACARRGADKLVNELLQLVDLKPHEHRKPQTLSGGEKQRLALIRALARRPKLLLLDEPFAALDAALKERLQEEVFGLYRRFGITTLFVSHELGDVFQLSNQVFVLEGGRVIRSGRPDEVFTDTPLSGKFKFIGRIIDIVADEVIHIVTVQIGSHIVKTVATGREVRDLKVGDKVVLASKAFNPVIIKLDN